MSVTNEKLDSKLKMQFDHGVDEEGRPILKSKTYSKVDPEALDESVYDVAKTIGNLQTKGVKAISRVDESVLSEA